MNDNFIKNKASITVEAALALPIFLAALISVLSFFRLLELQEALSYASCQAAEEASLYGFVFQDKLTEKDDVPSVSLPESQDDFEAFLQYFMLEFAGVVADAAYFKYRMSFLVPKDEIENIWITNGYDGISFLGSALLTKDHEVKVVMQYDFKIPVFGKLLPRLPVRQQTVIRSFTGRKVTKKGEANEGTGGEERVYITEHGTVYHTNRNCTYIKIKVEEIAAADIATKRNESGGIYYGCSFCADEKGQDKVYITRYGTRYHAVLSCSEIRREVKTVLLSEAGDRGLCKKCAAESKKEEE